MRAKYCCNEPVTPEDNTSSDKLLEWEWIVGKNLLVGDLFLSTSSKGYGYPN